LVPDLTGKGKRKVDVKPYDAVFGPKVI